MSVSSSCVHFEGYVDSFQATGRFRVHICLQCQKTNGMVETGVAQDQETVLLLLLSFTSHVNHGQSFILNKFGFTYLQKLEDEQIIFLCAFDSKTWRLFKMKGQKKITVCFERVYIKGSQYASLLKYIWEKDLGSYSEVLFYVIYYLNKTFKNVFQCVFKIILIFLLRSTLQ